MPQALDADPASSPAPLLLHAEPRCTTNVPPPCAKSELNALDPAERFACQCLKESNFSRAAVAHLFSILDKDPPPAKFEAPDAQSFSASCYAKGGIVGLRSACRKYPVTCAFLNQFVKSIRPDFHYSSISLFQDLRTGIHRDSKNAAEDNLLIPISDFKGGGVWLEGPGSDVQVLNGTPLSGQNMPVRPYIQFPAYSKHHCTLPWPWTGTRLVLVAYSVDRLHSLNPRDREVVQSTGFPLPQHLLEVSTCAPPPEPASVAPKTEEFLQRLKQRVGGKHCKDLIFIGVFAGSAGLCRAFKQCGYSQSLAVHKVASPLARAPIVTLDLCLPGSLSILLDLINRDCVAGIHLAPPCGTSSRARELPKGPPPLRSMEFPDGLPSLSGLDALRVSQANELYRVTALIYTICCRKGILCMIENPRRSHFWATKDIAALGGEYSLYASCHRCMMGSKRRKATLLLANFPRVCLLRLLCDGGHEHEPWGKIGQKFATASETAYPPLMCALIAQAFHKELLQAGVLPDSHSLHESAPSLARAASVAVGKQPKGKSLPPLMPEYSSVVKVTCAASELPAGPVLQAEWTLPQKATCVPAMKVIPVKSRVLSSHPVAWGSPDGPFPHGFSGCPRVECRIGLPCIPSEFVKWASRLEHPNSLECSVPAPLKKTIDQCLREGHVSIARARTEALRRWTQRAKDIASEGGDVDDEESFPEHCGKVLAGKSMRLFSEMLEHANYADKNLVKHMKEGFRLMGPLPETGAMPTRVTVGSLTPDEVRANAEVNNRAIFESAKTCRDHEVAQAVYDATISERDRGWLQGPIDFESLPKGAVLTRRFGVEQTSFDVNVGSVKKVRPIDDYTESLVNHTNSSTETISPHGIDAILSAAAYRIRKGRKLGLRESLVAKTVDLRKAYKQLPISASSLPDAFLCVFCTSDGCPKIFRSSVLPFGARAAVNNFCRVSQSLHWLGMILFAFHWSVFYDDFFVVGNSVESRHLDVMLKGFFALLAWETSTEKGSDFQVVAKALGVQFSFADSASGLLSVCNTEGRIKEVCNQIQFFLDRGRASAAELATLRGRILFADSQIFGRKSKQAMKVLSQACARTGSVSFNHDLSSALTCLKDRVLKGAPRLVHGTRRNKYLLFADACHEDGGAGLGGILYSPTGVVVSWFGEWVEPQELECINPDLKVTLIYELEASASHLACAVLCRGIRQADVICFSDNEAVLSNLITGKSDVRFVSNMLEEVYEWEGSHDCNLWFERVALLGAPCWTVVSIPSGWVFRVGLSTQNAQVRQDLIQKF